MCFRCWIRSDAVGASPGVSLHTSRSTHIMHLQRKTRSTTPTSSSPLTRMRSDSIHSDPGVISSERDKPDPDQTRPTPDKPKPASLKRCPCKKSSAGQAWLLECTACTQSWHNSCANLKGSIQKSTIASLDHWQCPWCFVSPYLPPDKHRSLKLADHLKSTVVSDALITRIEDSLRSVIEEKESERISDNTNTTMTDQNNDFIQSIRSELEKLESLTTEMANIKSNIMSAPESSSILTPSLIESSKSETAEDNVALPNYKENFITDEQADALSVFFEQESFMKEGNREVSFYGQKYQYMGSKKSPKPMPPILDSLVKSLNENLPYKLNQVLVNKYTGATSSLAEHSDDELDINPLSSIFTISIGSKATIKFKNIKNGDTFDLVANNNSLYEMTRELQNHCTHQILPNPLNTTRYSITIRCVHWKFLNSTYLTGDSNFGKIKFGEGRGTIGTSTPGCKDFAPTVDKLIPQRCASFRNTVIMCGTNDLKKPDADALEIYKVYKGKVEEMRKCNPKGNILICPVLPSRDSSINSRIVQFNRYLFTDLTASGLNIHVVEGFNQFVDHMGLLKESLHDRRTDSDVLHINEGGYCILVKQIKAAIFSLKQSRPRHDSSEILLSNVVRQPAPRQATRSR